MSAFIVIFTVLFLAGSGVFVYKLVSWNWEKRHIIHATRDVLENSSGMTRPDLDAKLREALGMEPLEK